MTCASSSKIKKCPFCRSEFIDSENDAVVLKHAQKLADMGKPWFQYYLGNAYIQGHHGLQKSYERAVYWFRRAADQGLTKAQSDLALCYRDGNGVPKCLITARKLFEQAAYRGQIESQTALAELHL